MSRTVHLPVECWREILQKAISVPLFFDTDPLQHYPASSIHLYSDEVTYWESERIRNTLRRVCFSWNVFLKQFDYRYVHAGHVMLGNAPAEALRMAIRINADYCPCRLCEGVYPAEQARSVAWRSSCAAGDDALRGSAAGTWRMRILQFSQSGFVRDIMEVPSRRQNLKAILDYDGGAFAQDALQWVGPNFITVAQHVDGVPKTFGPLGVGNLTTLYLSMIDMDSLAKVTLPNLQHMSVWTSSRFEDPCPLLEWLKSHGSRLVTLFWAGDVISGSFLAELWDLCPRLRNLELPWGTEWIPPPSDRSLALLRLDSEISKRNHQTLCSICDDIHSVGFQFENCIPQLGSAFVSSIAMRASWVGLLRQPTSFAMEIKLALCLKRCAASYGITMFDASGYTFEESVVLWLKEHSGSQRAKESTGWLEF